MKIKPLSPDELVDAKSSQIPDVVIEVVNDLLISSKYQDGICTILFEDIVANVIKSKPELTAGMIVELGWLNFENLYRSVGWDVEFYRSGYKGSYPAIFRFTKKK